MRRPRHLLSSPRFHRRARRAPSGARRARFRMSSRAGARRVTLAGSASTCRPAWPAAAACNAGTNRSFPGRETQRVHLILVLSVIRPGVRDTEARMDPEVVEEAVEVTEAETPVTKATSDQRVILGNTGQNVLGLAIGAVATFAAQVIMTQRLGDRAYGVVTAHDPVRVHRGGRHALRHGRRERAAGRDPGRPWGSRPRSRPGASRRRDRRGGLGAVRRARRVPAPVARRDVLRRATTPRCPRSAPRP